MEYETYPAAGSPEDLLIDEYLEHTNGYLCYLTDGKFYLDLPGESYVFDTLEALMEAITYAMNEWKGDNND